MVEAIWDSLAAEPEAVPVPASHIKELKKRLAAYDSAPSDVISWDEAKSKALKKLAE
jgi:putative addiction module component (TIGR02574 family)